MFEYIQKELKKRQTEMNPTESNSVNDDSLFIECAHLFQELSDLTESGNEDSNNARSIASTIIPVEDDLELSTIELDMNTNNVVDMPGDATASSALTESFYNHLKTFDDFYQEALNTTCKFVRGDNSLYENKAMEIAKQNYNAYKEQCIQEGLFGFGKIKLDDPEVPVRIIVDFGTDEKGKRVQFSVPVLFQVDNKKRILKKQLETANIIDKLISFENLPDKVFATVNEMFDVPKNKKVWDVVSLKDVRIPIDPVDSYKTFFVFETDFSDEEIWFSWAIPIKSWNKSNKNVTVKDLKIASKSDKNITMMNKKSYVKEQYEQNRPSRFKTYQEAISFGDETSNDDNNNNDNNNINVDMNNNDDLPPIDNGGNNSENTETVENNDQQSTQDTSENDNSIPVETNDVSDEIANKVADMNNDTTGSDLDSSIDGNINDMDADFDNADIDADTQLDQLDDMGSENMENDMGEIDFDNMTIDQLLEQGNEKLKGMTMQQLRDFLTTASPEEIQEAFIYTKGNINSELEKLIKISLGILNSDKMDLNQIIVEFKKNGKKLNRCLTKACKMKKVYNDTECSELSKLNTTLTNLMTMVKTNPNESDTATAKRSIKEFTSQCVVVNKIIEQHKSSNNNDKVTTEAFYQEGLFINARNIRKKIDKKIDLMRYYVIDKINKCVEKDTFTSGMFLKMFTPTKQTVTNTIGADDDILKTSYGKEYNNPTNEMMSIANCASIIDKAIRKKKLSAVFNESEKQLLNTIEDELDDFIEAIEAGIADNGSDKSLNIVIKYNEHIDELLKQYQNK